MPIIFPSGFEVAPDQFFERVVKILRFFKLWEFGYVLDFRDASQAFGIF